MIFFWFRVLIEETTEVLRERDYCSVGGFDSCRDSTCTIHCLKANIIIKICCQDRHPQAASTPEAAELYPSYPR